MTGVVNCTPFAVSYTVIRLYFGEFMFTLVMQLISSQCTLYDYLLLLVCSFLCQTFFVLQLFSYLAFSFYYVVICSCTKSLFHEILLRYFVYFELI